MAAVDSEKQAEEEKVVSGELLFCGTTAWDTIGKVYQKNDNLVSPTRLRPLIGVDIRFVASGCGKKLKKMRPLCYLTSVLLEFLLNLGEL